MALVFVDTNIVIDFLKSNKETIEKLNSFEHVYLNDIVLMELFQGAKNIKELKFIKRNIFRFEVLKIHPEIVILAREILEKYTLSHNTKIMDALIAATVISYDIKLYTLNKKDFRYLEQIKFI